MGTRCPFLLQAGKVLDTSRVKSSAIDYNTHNFGIHSAVVCHKKLLVPTELILKLLLLRDPAAIDLHTNTQPTTTYLILETNYHEDVPELSSLDAYTRGLLLDVLRRI